MYSDELISYIGDFKCHELSISIADREIYLNNLLLIHGLVAASEQLLITGINCITHQDNFLLALKSYYSNHLEEERGHHLLIEQDINAAGLQVKFPNRHAIAIAGSQYYLIQHLHPVCLLGYLLVVEGDPATPATISEVTRIYGDDLVNFLKLHSVKDHEHRLVLKNIVDMTPPALREFISNNINHTLDQLKEAVSSWRHLSKSSNIITEYNKV